MTTYNTLDIEIDKLGLVNGVGDFVKSQPVTFQQQFLFYRRDIGHSIEKSINRAMTETFEIYENLIYHVQCSLEDCNLNDNEKIENAKSFLSDFH